MKRFMRNMVKIKDNPTLGLLVILLCGLFCASASNAAEEGSLEAARIGLNEKVVPTEFPVDPAPAVVKGVQPEKIIYYTEGQRDESSREELDLYLDKFVVWCSDSAAVVTAITNPKYIQSIKRIPEYGWEIKVNTFDVGKGKTLRDRLKELPCVQGVENYAYSQKVKQEMTPFRFISVILEELADSIVLKNLADSLHLSASCIIPRLGVWHLEPKAGVKFNRSELVDAVINTNVSRYCNLEYDWKVMVIQEFTYDPYVKDQWGLYNRKNVSKPEKLIYTDLDISRAWDLATGHGVTIAVIDLGFDINNRDLKDNISLRHDCSTGEDEIYAGEDHGTACAGIASAIRNNCFGISGVAPDSKLILVRIANETVTLNKEVLTPQKQLAKAIDWAVENGADIISCSLGFNKSDDIKVSVENALKDGRKGKGCIFVKSAGNNGLTGGAITFPGTMDGVMAIGALDTTLRRLKESSYGSALFAMAPGEKICSLTEKRDEYMQKLPVYKKYSGTSMACPAIAGIAALVLEVYPEATAAKVREIIAKSCHLPKDVGLTSLKPFGNWSPEYGYGLVSAFKAVRKAIEAQTSGYTVPEPPYPIVED